METCSYLYSLENHFSHVSTYILQLWPDTCFLYISFSFFGIHALRILLCRIPLFHSSSTQYSAYPALTETFPSYLSLPAVACVILHILLLSVMAGYMPLYPPMPDTSFPHLLTATFHVSGIDGDLPFVSFSSRCGLMPSRLFLSFPSLPDTCLSYPPMPDTSFPHLLSATFHVSGIDGYNSLVSVSSHCGLMPSRLFLLFPSLPDTFPSYPPMQDTSPSFLLSVTICVSGIDGDLLLVLLHSCHNLDYFSPWFKPFSYGRIHALRILP